MKSKLPLVILGVAEVGRSCAFCVALDFVALNSGRTDVVYFDLDGVVLGLSRRAALAGDAGLDPEGAGFAEVTLALNEPPRGLGLTGRMSDASAWALRGARNEVHTLWAWLLAYGVPSCSPRLHSTSSADSDSDVSPRQECCCTKCLFLLIF